MRRWLVLATVYGLLLTLVFVPSARSIALTVGLVPELINLPIRPLSIVSPQPIRYTTTYGQPADRLDIYVPADASAESRLPAVVLALGVHPQPIDDPAIVAIATAMARCGAIVGVPDSTALRELRVTPEEPGHLADAALALTARPEADPDRIGLAGFSAGASMALLAAADPRLAGRVSFVSDFGGYFDAELLLVDVGTRTQRLDDVVTDFFPDAGIRHDVAVLLARAIEPPAGGELEPLLTAAVAPDGPPTAFDPRVADTLAGDARLAYVLFTARDRPTADAAVAGFSQALRDDLRAISPQSVLDRLDTRVYILHGASDTAIPFFHSFAVVERLPEGSLGRFTRFGRFGHGQPGQNGLSLDDAADIWELTLYLHDIVAATTEQPYPRADALR